MLLETVALGAHENQEFTELNLGASLKTAIQHGVSSKSYWHMARTPAMQQGISNAWLKAQGLVSVKDLWSKAQGYTV